MLPPQCLLVLAPISFPSARTFADSSSCVALQAEEHNGFLDALLDILQSEQDANLRLSSTCSLRDAKPPLILRCESRRHVGLV